MELMVALFVLAVALLAMQWMVGGANRSTMDAYLECTAQSLAYEPIEVLRGFGYDFLKNYAQHPLPRYPEGDCDLATLPGNGQAGVQQLPADALLFRRRITVTPIEDAGVRAVRISVTVGPAATNRVAAWLSRQSFTAEAMVAERLARIQ